MTDLHWADTAATRIINEKGKKSKYACAAGITPSGYVHIGNFREIITVDLVVKALESKGKKVRFVYSWDDYDRFRKVPKNMPKDFEKYIGMPISDIPDPFNCHKHYAEHFEKELESSIRDLGFNIEFIRQNQMFKKCSYADNIKFALNNKDAIRTILSKYRREPLSEEWWPIFVYCEKCKKDSTKVLEYDGKYNIGYECDCGYSNKIDFRKKGIVKLAWRVDWPMRWDYEKVDFEPGGKDHFAAGGSRQTCADLFENIWKKSPPYGFGYEFIAIKGGGEFSSSEGVIVTVKDMLEIYEPEMVRWLFAGTRPSASFNISFDLDVLKLYEDFDYCERVYFGKERGGAKELQKQKRIYELSAVKLPKKMPEQVGFRHLTVLTQIYEGDLSRFKGRTLRRAQCAWNWVQKYAPEDMKFTVHNHVSAEINKILSTEQKKALKELEKRLAKEYKSDDALFEEFYKICESIGIKNTEFFEGAYLALIGKKRGPKLANFILVLGKERVRKLLSQVQ